jgi:hypothetical protein
MVTYPSLTISYVAAIGIGVISGHLSNHSSGPMLLRL